MEVGTSGLMCSPAETSRHLIENKYFAHNPFAFNILQAVPIYKLLK
jgi:hypothetical protein